MNKSEALVQLIKRYKDVQIDLQITSYEYTNKPYFPDWFHTLKEVGIRSLEYEIKLLEGKIKEENESLDNPPIENVVEFSKIFEAEAV